MCEYTYVHNVGLLLSDGFEVPLPHLSGDGLTDRSQHTEVLHLVLDVLIAGTLQQTQRSGRNVELADVVLVDDIPVAREVGVGWCTLEDDCSDTKQQRSVDDVCVPCDPTYITTAEECVAVVNVEDVLSSCCCAEEVTSSCVHDTLWLASGARSVEQEERVLRAHRLGGNVVGVLVDLLVPPPVSALRPGNLSTCALVDQAVADARALLEGLVDNLLGRNDLASTLALVSGDDDLALSIDDTVAQRVRRETGKDDRVHGTNTCAGQERDDSLGNHRQVESNSVTLLDTHLLEGVCELGDLAEELSVCDDAAIACIVGLVDDGGLVGVLEGVAVDAVVRRVQLALDEPCIVAVLEATGVNCLEIALPREQLAC